MDTPIQYNPQQQDKSFSFKEAAGYTLLAGVLVAAAIHYGSKKIEQGRENKSNTDSFTPGTPKYIAKEIKMFLENDYNLGKDIAKLRYVLTKIQSKEELNKVRKEYFDQNQSVLDNDLKKELQSSEFIELSQIIGAKPLKTGGKVTGEVLYKSWAIRLKAAFDKTYSFIPGTDNEAVKAVLDEIPTQRSFVNVGVAYYKEFHRQLMDDLKSEMEGNEYYTFLKMITDKPKA